MFFRSDESNSLTTRLATRATRDEKATVVISERKPGKLRNPVVLHWESWNSIHEKSFNPSLSSIVKSRNVMKVHIWIGYPPKNAILTQHPHFWGYSKMSEVIQNPLGLSFKYWNFVIIWQEAWEKWVQSDLPPKFYVLITTIITTILFWRAVGSSMLG